MNALDSPLEALALNYLTYGFLTAVNNIWAWLAVITAAVSFWRIRALSSAPVSTPRRSQDTASTSSAPPELDERAVSEPATVSTTGETQLSSSPTKTSCPTLEREGSTKTKFSLYYEEDDFRVDDDGGENEDDGGGAAVVGEKSGRCLSSDDWERMMVVVRMGDMGWYRWQDRAVFDGSVVRLWEGRGGGGDTRRRCWLMVAWRGRIGINVYLPLNPPPSSTFRHSPATDHAAETHHSPATATPLKLVGRPSLLFLSPVSSQP
ncbi:hypothetical protein Salat_1180400 [Sesamum alatum]|uniref:Uncharacterized protein n=1 Tax=Sesamum alatum TaxID=300844 RepID=A0AAE1YER9_9LAMI|nr:hypothetical protein Salat_1180400 [Sesamum alatum]